MIIKILGTGCPNCKALEMLSKDIVSELGLDAKVEKVDDIMEIMKYNILSTPGVVINEKVVLSGRIPSRKELTTIIIKK